MEEVNTEKYQLYTIDDNLYCIDNKTNDIYRIDFDNKEIEKEDTSKENDDLNQEDSEEKEEDEEETEPEDNSEKDPKKDGSGKGKRANQGRSGCKETEEKGKGKEESEEESEKEDNLDENKEKEQNESDVSDPDLNINLKNAIKNKKKGGCDMDFENKENHETSEHKPDGSEAAKERLITQCMEKSGKSREACTKEVRKKMHETDAEAVNPEDMKDESEEKETVEVCTKEYDFLKKESEELKALKDEKEKADNNLESLKADFLVYKKKVDDKEASEKEVERQEVIKRISYDFDIPEEKLKDKTIEQLLDNEEILELGLKRDTKETEKETFGEEEDFKEIGDRIHKRYFLEV